MYTGLILATVILFNFDNCKLETFTEWYTQTTYIFWIYNLIIILNFFAIVVPNLIFMKLTLDNFKHRAYVRDLLTQVLHVDLCKRSSNSIKMATINFCSPKSILTWLEMRRMSLDVGLRFWKRFEMYLGFFVIIYMVEGLFIVTNVLGYIDSSNYMSQWHWISLVIHFFT